MIKSLKVAGIIYEVEEVDNMIKERGQMGLVMYQDSKIMIDSSMSDTRKEQVLIHELTHAIFNEAGFEEQEEDTINRISIILHQVLKDNDLNFKDEGGA